MKATTVCYKTTSKGLKINIDVRPPDLSTFCYDLADGAIVIRPAFLYFHAGGLVYGNRRSFIPRWLSDRVATQGWLFISADYRLIPPSTGDDILEDVRDLWNFLTNRDLTLELDISASKDDRKTAKFKFKADSIAVGGSSGGGLCAYLAAVHCRNPKPVAILSIYGMGGDFFTPHYLVPKQEKFPRAAEFLKEKDFKSFLHPFEEDDLSEVAHDPRFSRGTLSARVHVSTLYLQSGVWLDYYTGRHDPSISRTLQRLCRFSQFVSPLEISVADEGVRDQVVEEVKCVDGLFPQLKVSSDWPPVFLIHGSGDTSVPVGESVHLYGLLQEAGVPAELVMVEGEEHGFDQGKESESKWGSYFDRAMEWLRKYAHE
ncbi:hypothetical protein CC2G_012579 [Coprinopsis cinerea AmutBmut pab1-1]|nr:hypothetical protein CC2G_012579 [Coprinopsis cinerea AmutBmut pab1-1]